MSSDPTNRGPLVVARLFAPYPADVFLFHPHDPHLFIVGTYLLDETTRLRHGKICLYQLRSLETTTPGDNVERVAEYDCDAVLDMKWYKGRLFVGHSTGSLSIYECTHSDSIPSLSLLVHRTVLDPTILIMSLSLSDGGLMTSHSDGTAVIWSHSLEPICSWEASDMEVWIQAWGKDQDIVFTGSDDGILQSWDIRARLDNQVVLGLQNKKSHGAGVTAILPYHGDHELLTGSYDDRIRRFDLRKPGRPLDEVNLGGGVWRIIPMENHELAVCCMYDGAKVVKNDDFSIVKHFEEHDSMVYGGDVTSGMIGTCSFYDKKVCIWR